LADGEDVTLEQIRKNLAERDQSDSQRAVAPLVKPEGAIEIDTTRLSIHEVIELLLKYISGQAPGAATGKLAAEIRQP
jgi:cytidylate kinase